MFQLYALFLILFSLFTKQMTFSNYMLIIEILIKSIEKIGILYLC